MAAPDDRITGEGIESFRKTIATWRGFSDDEREEIVAETLVAFSSRLRRESIRRPLRWLLSSAKRVAMNLRRRWSREPQLEYPDLNGIEEHRYCVWHRSPRRLRRVVASAMAKLSEDQRRVVLLCDIRDTSESVAAKKLGVCRSTAKSRHKRAHDRLRSDPSLQEAVATRTTTAASKGVRQ